METQTTQALEALQAKNYDETTNLEDCILYAAKVGALDKRDGWMELDMAEKAATELAALRAEIERLRAALRNAQQKRHEYGIWIAKLCSQPSSHADPIDECDSPGCVEARAALSEGQNGG